MSRLTAAAPPWRYGHDVLTKRVAQLGREADQRLVEQGLISAYLRAQEKIRNSAADVAYLADTGLPVYLGRVGDAHLQADGSWLRHVVEEEQCSECGRGEDIRATYTYDTLTSAVIAQGGQL